MLAPVPVVVAGQHRLKGGKRIPVWSCEGHSAGVEGANRLYELGRPRADA
jgi:hypothetical protein